MNLLLDSQRDFDHCMVALYSLSAYISTLQKSQSNAELNFNEFLHAYGLVFLHNRGAQVQYQAHKSPYTAAFKHSSFLNFYSLYINRATVIKHCRNKEHLVFSGMLFLFSLDQC